MRTLSQVVVAALPEGVLQHLSNLKGADDLLGQSGLPLHQQGFCLRRDHLLSTRKESSNTVAISSVDFFFFCLRLEKNGDEKHFLKCLGLFKA